MAKQDRISVTLTSKETLWGAVWLLFELFLLPLLLGSVNAALNYPLNSAWVNFLYFVLNFAAVTGIFRSFLKRSFGNLKKHWLRCIKGAFLGFCVYYVSNQAMTNLMGFLFPWFSNVNDSSISALLHTDYLPMVIGTVFLVPVAEELLFRGLVFQRLYVTRRWMGYVLSTVLFCAIHVMGYVSTQEPLTLLLCFLQYIPASLCLAWAYVQGDSIFSPILIHIVVNAMGVMAVR